MRKAKINPFMYVFLLAGVLLLCLWAGRLTTAAPAAPGVILLPLDSRPVNTDLPRQLAAIAGVNVILPEQELLDQFLTPSQPEPLFQWLREREKSGREVAVLHVNQLLFGSLLHSREQAQYETANEKLRSLHDYLLERDWTSERKIVLVYILPRLLPSQYDAEMWAYEKELPAFSQLKHRLSLTPGDGALAAELAALTELIPPAILQRYENLYTQAYNTGVSLLEWLYQGLIDEIVIGLDDSSEYGLNVQTFQELKTAASYKEGQAFFLHGADELTPLIIARHCLGYGGDPETFTLAFLSPDQEDIIFPYESIPLRANFQEKLDYLFAGFAGRADGAPIADGAATAQAGVGRAARPKWIYLHTRQDLSQEEQDAAVWRLEADSGRPAHALVGLADVAKVNGTWPPLLERIGVERLYQVVDAYAGWNTAGNSLGSVMAHLLFWEAAGGLPEPVARQAAELQGDYQRLRLIDDYFFQSLVKQQLIDWTIARGFPYLTFGSRWMEANDQLQSLMAAALAPWPQMLPGGRAPRAGEPYPYRFRFPWPRSFEIWIQRAN
ncbi:MAG: DUF4127 family protein [Peptococcaceae bacterium]|jgi:hypothetical protein|nr:DUF4127 family protein [Peptococcaceae bacterium]